MADKNVQPGRNKRVPDGFTYDLKSFVTTVSVSTNTSIYSDVSTVFLRPAVEMVHKFLVIFSVSGVCRPTGHQVFLSMNMRAGRSC